MMKRLKPAPVLFWLKRPQLAQLQLLAAGLERARQTCWPPERWSTQ